jgi:hypothetical protein
MNKSAAVIPSERIEKRIFLLRGQKVMLSTDLAELYGVPTKALTQAVRRNADRFSDDFVFLVAREELAQLRSQIVTSSSGYGGYRHRLLAFTEQGVAMLSSVLKSRSAVRVNIAIMRAFVHLRHVLSSHLELARKLDELERRVAGHDEQIVSVFEAIRELMRPPEPARKGIGFGVRERRARYRA